MIIEKYKTIFRIYGNSNLNRIGRNRKTLKLLRILTVGVQTFVTQNERDEMIGTSGMQIKWICDHRSHF